MGGRKLTMYLVVLGLLGIFAACNVYDERMVSDNYDFGDAGGQLELLEDEGVRRGDEVCGDGRVTGTELCDIAIKAGTAGACPTVCSTTTPCFITQLRGAGCYSVCLQVAFKCEGGDDCCPPTCDSSNDSDCQGSCGDGVVQPEEGERCEPESPAARAKSLSSEFICPTRCQDDGNPCTIEVLSGNPTQCNARCTRSKVTFLIHGDRCCPAGANANQDLDCLPVCGNGIKEFGEQCDGSTGCGEGCHLLLTEEYYACVNKLAAPFAAMNGNVLLAAIQVLCLTSL